MTDEPLPLAVRLRDESGPPLPQMVAQRRAALAIEATKQAQQQKNIEAFKRVRFPITIAVPTGN